MRYVLCETLEAYDDLTFTVNVTKDTSALLTYIVTGAWQTGLLKVIVNGEVVADYSGLFGLWPFTGSETKSIQLKKGTNNIVFEVKVQNLIFMTAAPSITAYLDIAEAGVVEKTEGGVQTSTSAPTNAFIILIILLVLLLLLRR